MKQPGRNGSADRRNERKPLIVFCDAYPYVYGAQRSMLELYRCLHASRQYRLHFLYFKPGELTDAVAALGIPVTRIDTGRLLGAYNKRLLSLRWTDAPIFGAQFWRYNHRVYRFLLRHQADLVHCNTDRATLMGFAGMKAARCPIVTHFRRDVSFGWRDRLVHRVSDEMIWVSQRVRREFAQRHGIVRLRGTVIYNGRILPDRDQPDTSADVCSEFSLPSDSLRALVAAGFDERKDHETLVEAAKMACAKEHRLVFLLAGGDYSPGQIRMRQISDMIRAYGLENRVRLLGHRRDIGRLMRGVHLLVNAARQEALGGAMIEAIGYGTPCVATDVGGTAEIVPDRVCGYLVPPQDADTLARRTLDLIHDRATRARFSRNAHDHFERHFTLERCAERTSQLFNRLIQRKGRRRQRTSDSAPGVSAMSHRRLLHREAVR